MRRPSTTVLIAVIAVVAAIATCSSSTRLRDRVGHAIGLPFTGEWGSPRDAAHILIHDRKFGMRAIASAIEFGDASLAPLREESQDFATLDNRNSDWVARVLIGIRTPAARDLASELGARANARPRLVGLAALAAHGSLPTDDASSAFLADAALDRLPGDGAVRDDFPELAALALGHVGGERSVRVLADMLSVSSGYWTHARACEALGQARDPAGIPVLRACLARPDFYALPEAFRALVRLGDRQAVPLAIARIDDSIRGRNSGFVVDALEEVTGQAFGYDRAAWERWWKTDGATWQPPPVADDVASKR